MQFTLKNYLSEYTVETPIGKLRISVLKDKINNISFVEDSTNSNDFSTLLPIMKKAIRQLEEYFNGERKNFDLVLNLSRGTEFQSSVWKAAIKIPYGEVRTYAQIARDIGNPLAYRAVANALASNPFVIVVPCHRVVSKKGIGGFSAGVWRKKWLLSLENMEEDVHDNKTFRRAQAYKRRS